MIGEHPGHAAMIGRRRRLGQGQRDRPSPGTADRGRLPWQNAALPESGAIDEQAYLALIRGERRGPVAAAARGGLCLAAGLFRIGAAVRSSGYAAGLLAAHRVPRPVISVGNLSAGGTGKTPLTIALARALLRRGLRVGVLARGYGAARDGELNDELRLIGQEVPEALLTPGRDRVRRAREAIVAGADALLLDDGFQHRRLARDLDLVLLDATAPWGTPPRWMLPRGLLREPPAALRRADAVILSRVELAGSSALAALEEEVRRLGFEGPVLRMAVRPARLSVLAAAPGHEELPGDEPTVLADRPLVAACGIGNPSSFAATLAALKARTTQLIALPDHHAYTFEDVDRIEDVAIRRAVQWVCVTEKDAVKLREPLAIGVRRATWVALGVEAAVEPEATLEALLDQALSAAPAEEEGLSAASPGSRPRPPSGRGAPAD